MTDKDLEMLVNTCADASGYGGLDTSTMYGTFALDVAKEVREACAKLCEAEHVGKSLDDGKLCEQDFCYNNALRDAAAAIRGA